MYTCKSFSHTGRFWWNKEAIVWIFTQICLIELSFMFQNWDEIQFDFYQNETAKLCASVDQSDIKLTLIPTS